VARSPGRGGLGMAALPLCTREDVEAGNAGPARPTDQSIHAVLTISTLSKGGIESGVKPANTTRATASFALGGEGCALEGSEADRWGLFTPRCDSCG
jgi:hypothetical protein